MAKNYDIDRVRTTGWWSWECTNDVDDYGFESSKSAARSAAKDACGGVSDASFGPPEVEASVKRGFLSDFTVRDLDDKEVTFSVAEINEAEFAFFFGMPCSRYEEPSDARKAITILKIWGIYQRGSTVEQIKDAHDLNQEQFDKLIAKDYIGLEINIDDEGNFTWHFPE